MLPSIFSENLFDDFFGRDFEKNFFGKGFYGGQNQLMKTDVKESENGYMIDIDLPGFNKEDVNVELKDGYLVLGETAYMPTNRRSALSGETITVTQATVSGETATLS